MVVMTRLMLCSMPRQIVCVRAGWLPNWRAAEVYSFLYVHPVVDLAWMKRRTLELVLQLCHGIQYPAQSMWPAVGLLTFQFVEGIVETFLGMLQLM
jgi:hypothetical protein